MTVLFIILIILACIILSLIVLVQNPKGGGLSGNIAGFSNQFMGVKQTTDVLEKGTWIFAAVIAVLCVTSTFFISRGTTTNTPAGKYENVPVPAQSTKPNTATFPANAQPLPGGDTNKK
ncbi:MAG: preprotein translocase subunit SecG [Chitinophagaceae bacterium]